MSVSGIGYCLIYLFSLALMYRICWVQYEVNFFTDHCITMRLINTGNSSLRSKEQIFLLQIIQVAGIITNLF
jgi:hypothetical protein